MLVHEALQIGLRNQLRRRMPDKISAKLKFTHAVSLEFTQRSRKRAFRGSACALACSFWRLRRNAPPNKE